MRSVEGSRLPPRRRRSPGRRSRARLLRKRTPAVMPTTARTPRAAAMICVHRSELLGLRRSIREEWPAEHLGTARSAAGFGGVSAAAADWATVAPPTTVAAPRGSSTDTVRVVEPIVISSPPASSSGRSIRVPSTNVPFVDPRSVSTARPSGSGSRDACRREAFSSSSARSASYFSRPMTKRSPVASTVRALPSGPRNESLNRTQQSRARLSRGVLFR